MEGSIAGPSMKPIIDNLLADSGLITMSILYGIFIFHIYFHILYIFVQGTNSISILFYNFDQLKLKYLINYYK